MFEIKIFYGWKILGPAHISHTNFDFENFELIIFLSQSLKKESPGVFLKSYLKRLKNFVRMKNNNFLIETARKTRFLTSFNI